MHVFPIVHAAKRLSVMYAVSDTILVLARREEVSILITVIVIDDPIFSLSGPRVVVRPSAHPIPTHDMV